jgi:hypothetical protein
MIFILYLFLFFLPSPIELRRLKDIQFISELYQNLSRDAAKENETSLASISMDLLPPSQFSDLFGMSSTLAPFLKLDLKKRSWQQMDARVDDVQIWDCFGQELCMWMKNWPWK